MIYVHDVITDEGYCFLIARVDKLSLRSKVKNRMRQNFNNVIFILSIIIKIDSL